MEIIFLFLLENEGSLEILGNDAGYLFIFNLLVT